MVRGYRLCTHPKHLGRRWLQVFDFHPRERDQNGETVRIQSHCKTCQRVEGRERNGYKPREWRVGGKKYWHLTDEEKAVLNEKRRRRYRERKGIDLEERKGDHRFVENRNDGPENGSRTEKPRLPSLPLKEYVDDLPDWKSRQINPSDKSKLKYGQEEVTLAFIDRVLSATGDVHMLSILYPDDEGEDEG